MAQTSNGGSDPGPAAGEPGGKSPSAPPAPPAKPDRGSLTLRDMLGTVLVLVVVIAAVALLSRGCEFSPGRPSVDQGSEPSVDAARELSVAAQRRDFPVRLPALPPTWHANSGNTLAVGADAVAVRVGWLTDRGKYLRLSQSSAPAGPLVAAESGSGEAAAPQPTGEVVVDGTRWTTYPGQNGEPAWVATLDGATVLITGSGTDDEFRTMAAAVRAATPLPKHR